MTPRRRLAALPLLAALAACDGSTSDVVISVPDAGSPADVPDASAPLDAPAARDVPAAPDTPALDAPSAPDALDVPALPDAVDVASPTDAVDVPARCASDGDCRAPTSVCDVPSGRCVACTATDEGGCPASEHCDGATNTCVRGCRADEGCATGDGGLGRCDTAQHACVECVTDGHCAAGRLCVGSVCVPGCSPGQACPAGQACCGGACAEVGTNLAHCGGCGNVCRAPNAAPACMNGACVVGMCAEGFADCNRRGDDGCETRTTDDTASCGACGNACPSPPNASAATCAAGRCGFTCAAGFADCDRDPANGCEVDLRSSATHCGLCGNACPSRPNATAAVCASGRCDVSCAPGYGNCDADAANGCEQPLTDTPAHCGRCGGACPIPANATPTCAAGACGGACNPGFGDCDGSPGNGCETALATTTAHCGACGRGCAAANGTAACVASACAVAACNAGFANCDGSPANGCEVNLATDVNNCGACGARGTEVCDGRDNDCDGASDEGCPTGLSGLSTFDFQSPSWGGGGGGAYDLQCPGGQFVTGIYGRAGSRIDQLGIVCGTASFVEDRGVTPFRYRVDFATSGTVGPVGGGGGGAFRYDCPGNSVVMRVQGRSGARLDQLRVECYRWDIESSGGAWRIVRSPTTGGSSFLGGGGGDPFDHTCPSTVAGVPSAVRRAFGGSGSEVDRVGVWCTWPVLTTR